MKIELEIELDWVTWSLMSWVAFKDKLGAVVSVAKRITDSNFCSKRQVKVKLLLAKVVAVLNCIKMNMEAPPTIKVRSMVRRQAPRSHEGVAYFL